MPNSRLRVALGGFPAGTLVHTRECLLPIEQIKVGDYVLSSPEQGGGKSEYKRVISTLEKEAQETWFVSWEDPVMHEKLKAGVAEEEYLAAYGNGFVATTPDHPFWVVDSDEEELRWAEAPVRLGPPYPRQQWVRADHLYAGMRLQLADGRIVDVMESARVYKTHETTQGWVDAFGDGSRGLLIRMADQTVTPHMSLRAHRFRPPYTPLYDAVENPNQEYADDDPPGSAPNSWYRSKVHNLEVEDFDTYYVDIMGVWVHTEAAE